MTAAPRGARSPPAGGQTRDLLTAGPITTISVATDPRNPSVVYAACATAYFAAVKPPCADPIYKSTDGGATWAGSGKGLPALFRAGILMTDAGTPNRLYAADNASTGGLYLSDNAGTAWTLLGAGLPGDWPILALTIDSTDPSVLYAASGAGGLYRSSDAGANWTLLTGMRVPVISAIAVDPSNPAIIYTGAYADQQNAFVMKILP